MPDFHCRIAPYALFNALSALERTKDSSRWIEYGVTQEDGELVIWGIERCIKHDDVAHARKEATLKWIKQEVE